MSSMRSSTNIGRCDFFLDGEHMDPDSERVLREWFSQNNRNVTGYANPRVDELIEKIKTEMVTYARDAYLEEAWQIVTEDVVYLPIRHGVSVFAMRENLDDPARSLGRAALPPRAVQGHRRIAGDKRARRSISRGCATRGRKIVAGCRSERGVRASPRSCRNGPRPACGDRRRAPRRSRTSGRSPGAGRRPRAHGSSPRTSPGCPRRCRAR